MDGKNKKWLIALNILMALALFIIIGSQVFSSDKSKNTTAPDKSSKVEEKKDNEDSDDEVKKDSKKEETRDIRYANVKSGNIREDHDATSEAVGIATFGDAFVVEEKYHDDTEDADWFKVKTMQGKKKEGWMGGSILKKVDVPSDKDSEWISAIEDLTNKSIEDDLEALGEKPDDDQNENIEYKTKKDIVQEMIIETPELKRTEVIEGLGEPQLDILAMLLYIGEDYEFIFDFKLDDVNQIETLTISKQ